MQRATKKLVKASCAATCESCTTSNYSKFNSIYFFWDIV